MKQQYPQKKGNRHEEGASPLVSMAQRFMTFCEDYRGYFTAARHNVSDKAQCYLAGLLMKAPRKNMERMEEYVAAYNYEAQQQFLSASPWDHDALVARVADDVNKLVGGPDSGLLIDESCFEKKGVKSVGVARQWNGRLGKVENSQVGVYAALSDGRYCGLVDFRLYLPECWVEDAARCDEAKIPKDKRCSQPKGELALEMIDTAVERGLQFGSVNLDGGYGQIPWLLRSIDDRALTFVADVHRNQPIYPQDPHPYLPRRKQPKGRKFSKRRARVDPVDISAFFAGLPDNAWHAVSVRDSTKGTVRVRALSRRVWLWDGEETQAREWWAVCVRVPDSGEVKWFLSNASRNTTLTALVAKHAIRFWIERAFQDAKTSVGMADYQARGWVAWHHHMALVLLALLFMLRERKLHSKSVELLSCQDIVELLNYYLPRADTTEEAVLRNLDRRHRKRQLSIEAAKRANNGKNMTSS